MRLQACVQTKLCRQATFGKLAPSPCGEEKSLTTRRTMASRILSGAGAMSARTVGLAEPLGNTTDLALTGALVARQQVLHVVQAPTPARIVVLMASRFFPISVSHKCPCVNSLWQPTSQRIPATSLYDCKSKQTRLCSSYAGRWLYSGTGILTPCSCWLVRRSRA